MYCTICHKKWVNIQGDNCPSCHRKMVETNYSFFCEEKATEEWTVVNGQVVKAGEDIQPVNMRKSNTPKLTLEEKQDIAEEKENKAIAHYMEVHERQGNEIAGKTFFETFK